MWSIRRCIDEYLPSGGLLQSIALPQVDATAFSLSANDPYVGLISREANRSALLVVGYGAPAGTPNVELKPASVYPRTVAIVWINGTVDTDSVMLDEFGGDWQNPGLIRSAASDDMVDIW